MCFCLVLMTSQSQMGQKLQQLQVISCAASQRRVLSNTATFDFQYFERFSLFHFQILLHQNWRREDAPVWLRYDLFFELFKMIKRDFWILYSDLAIHLWFSFFIIFSAHRRVFSCITWPEYDFRLPSLVCALATTSPATMHRLVRSSRPSQLCSSAPVDSRAEYSCSFLRDSGEIIIIICRFTCPFDRLWYLKLLEHLK